METTYKIKDLAIAAYLLTVGFLYKNYVLDQDNPKEVWFEFEIPEGINVVVYVEGYKSNLASVNPAHYYQNIKRLKRVIFDISKNGK